MISQSDIDRIFSTADIVEVIQDFVNLKRAGQNYKGLSPFVNEKTPSFVVSPSKGIYKDFSSGLGGNVVGFLMEHEKISYPEALRYLAKKYNIDIKEEAETESDVVQRNERESLMIVTSYAAKLFVDVLHKHAEGKAIGLSYFKERGFNDATIEKFQLGYSPKERNYLFQEATKKGYKADYLIKSGLCIDNERGAFDRFSERVIFPIHGLSGNVVGFGGRTLRSDKKIAKYLNSPESEIYHKSNLLYGIFFAKKEILQHDKCFMVEGYTDVISLHQAGIENVVASSGTALTSAQIRLVKRFTKNLTILYDGDPAGIKASLRGIDLVLEEEMNVKVVLLPEGEDPDSFSRSMSSSDFLEYIATHETDFIRFKSELLIEEAQSDPVKRANLISDILKSIAIIPDAIIRSVYVRESSDLLKINEEVLYGELQKIRLKRLEKSYYHESPSLAAASVNQTVAVPAFVDHTFSENEEKEIINLLFNFGERTLRVYDEGEEGVRDFNADIDVTVSRYIVTEIQNDELEFNNLVYKQIFEESEKMLQTSNAFDVKHFINHENKEIRSLAASLMATNHKPSDIWTQRGRTIETPDITFRRDVKKIIEHLQIKSRSKSYQNERRRVEETKTG